MSKAIIGFFCTAERIRKKRVLYGSALLFVIFGIYFFATDPIIARFSTLTVGEQALIIVLIPSGVFVTFIFDLATFWIGRVLFIATKRPRISKAPIIFRILGYFILSGCLSLVAFFVALSFMSAAILVDAYVDTYRDLCTGANAASYLELFPEKCRVAMSHIHDKKRIYVTLSANILMLSSIVSTFSIIYTSVILGLGVVFGWALKCIGVVTRLANRISNASNIHEMPFTFLGTFIVFTTWTVSALYILINR